MRCRVNYEPIPRTCFIVRLVERSFHRQNDITPPPLKLSVTVDGLTAETGLTIKRFTWYWLITHLTIVNFNYINEKIIISVNFICLSSSPVTDDNKKLCDRD